MIFSTDPGHQSRRNGSKQRERRRRWWHWRNIRGEQSCCAVSSWPNARWHRRHCSALIAPEWQGLYKGKHDLLKVGSLPEPKRNRNELSFHWKRNKSHVDFELQPDERIFQDDQ